MQASAVSAHRRTREYIPRTASSVSPCVRMPSIVSSVAMSGSTIRSSTSKITRAPDCHARRKIVRISALQVVRHRMTASLSVSSPTRAPAASSTSRTVVRPPSRSIASARRTTRYWWPGVWGSPDTSTTRAPTELTTPGETGRRPSSRPHTM